MMSAGAIDSRNIIANPFDKYSAQGHSQRPDE
jgi:hypothetical protein